MRRRHFIQSLAAAPMLWGLPFGLRSAHAADNGARFVFVKVAGGWDPTTVFAPLFSNENVDLERDAEPLTLGALPLVDHQNRPKVRNYFERWHDSSLIFNGINVNSVSHEICEYRMFSGNPSGQGADWPTHIAAVAKDAFTLPHLVLDGPTMVGPHADSVSKVGASGQLNGLVTGTIHNENDPYVGRPSALTERLMDRYVQGRTDAHAQHVTGDQNATLLQGLSASSMRSTALKNLRGDINFRAANSFTSQVRTALDALSQGLSRCITLFHDDEWDSHNDNTVQGPLFEDLFDGLTFLRGQLENRLDPSGVPLSQSVNIVVYSEMGRTPKLNNTRGKDHWPYTSAMITGPGVVESRVIGGYNQNYNGEFIDLGTGEISDSGESLSAETFGATLLAMADIDPAEVLPGHAPIQGILQ